MLRKLSLAVAIASLCVNTTVQALGVGTIKLDSRLNENLDAVIPLVSVNEIELLDVSAGLASPSVFKSMGVERPFILSYLDFETDWNDGNPVIRITSNKAIREPYLDFLLEVNWPSGRVLRQFTVLLDPPVTADAKPVSISVPASSGVPVQQKKAPAQRSSSSSASTQSTGSGNAVSADYGPTQRNDTAWVIADRMRPAGVSVEQMMMALLEKNPDAFYGNNVNNLKRGKILRAPSMEQIEERSKADARAQFRQQVSDWKSGTISRPQAASRAPETPSSQPRLKISAPAASVKTAGVTGSGADSAAAASKADQARRLEQELLMAQESSQSAVQASEALAGRVAQLEKQLQTLQRMLQVKDNQLASMQQRLNQGGSDQPASSSPVAEDSKPVTAPPVSTASTSAAAQEPAKPAAKPAPSKVPAPKESPASGQSDTGVSPSLGDYLPIVLGVLGLLVGVAVLIWLVLRRRTSGPNFQESILAGPRADSLMPESSQSYNPGPASQETDETSFLSDFSPSDIDALQDDTGEVDPLAEADVYIAYGRYQQAEELIRAAISGQPDRLDLKYKLLEIYFANKDAAAYSGMASEMKSQGAERDEDLWRRIRQMGQMLVPGDELFADTSGDDIFSDSGVPDNTAPQMMPSADEAPESQEADSEILNDSMFGSLDETGPTVTPSLEDTAPEAVLPGLDDSTMSQNESPDGPEEVNTKLELAMAYVDMGDPDNARSILNEVISEGSEAQVSKAQQMLSDL